MTGYRIEPLAGHDRSAFFSGSSSLDRYFRETVSQDVRRRVTNCFVAIGEAGDVAGFYTLSATSVALESLRQEQTQKLPRYPKIPAGLLGRLAVARAHQGRRLGAALVADALLRSAQSDLAAHFLIVDAKDETAALFYEYLGFERLEDGRLIRTV